MRGKGVSQHVTIDPLLQAGGIRSPLDEFLQTGFMPEAMLKFHRKLYSLVRKYYKQGLQDFEMKDRVIAEMSEYRTWHNFSEMGRVIGYVYREIENDSF